MIAFFDKDGVKTPLSAYEDFCVTHKIDGCDEMSFCVDTKHEQYKQLFEECRVLAAGNDWLIKKIDDDKMDCELNFDFLKTSIYSSYKSETRLLTEVLEDHLPEGWTVEGADVSTIRRTIEFDFCTDFDVVYECMHTYNVYFIWNIPQKRLIVVDPTQMQPTGEYLTSELNLKNLSFKGESTDFATRLYAYGKDGMTIEDAIVDGKRYGLPYVESKKYCNKTVCAYWNDDRYTVPENLYEDAKAKIETMSFPVRSYECTVVDLAKQNSDYSFLDFSMHKKITLIDTERHIKVEHQIVEYTEYPDENDRNKVTLSCVPETIQGKISGISSSVNDDIEKVNTSFSERISMVTAMMTGAFGSYLYSNGSELFMMDNPDPALAKIVWRWNVNGFAKSSTGIDGPYTTAMTFDDQFITNVINAMVIRGSLIEADSIQASSISQSYTDEVLGQSFTAAEGLVEAMFTEIMQYLSNDDESGTLDVLEKTVTEISQTLQGLSVKLSTEYLGGINYVKNSSGLNGVSSDWTYTGTVTTQHNDDTKNSTVANSCFCLGEESTLSQSVDNIIVGKVYTLSMKVKKSSTLLSEIKVIYNGENQAVIFSSSEVSEWNEYTLLLDSIQTPIIEIQAKTRNSGLYIADIMLCEGNVRKSWTPAPNEIYTSGVKIDKEGIEVWRSDSDEKTVINNREFAGYYNGSEVFSLNRDETRMNKTVIDGDLTVGDLKFIPFDNASNEAGANITLID